MVESVYSAVRTDSLYTANYVWSLERLKSQYLSKNKQRLVPLIGFYSRGGKCLQPGTDCFLKYSRLPLVFRKVRIHPRMLNLLRTVICKTSLSHFRLSFFRCFSECRLTHFKTAMCTTWNSAALWGNETMTSSFVSRRICLSAGRVSKWVRFVWEVIAIRPEDLRE